MNIQACLPSVPETIGPDDEAIFQRITATRLSGDQEATLLAPERVFPQQQQVMAVHWHPEFVPISLAVGRMQAMFPGRGDELVIPTQHNTLMTYAGLSGVEVDCWSRRFNQKVQLLVHLRQDQAAKATALQSMLNHTRRYREAQLFDFLHTLTRPDHQRLELAASKTGADADLIQFVTGYVRRIEILLHRHEHTVPSEMRKNKIVRNFFNALRPKCGHRLIERAQYFLKKVKTLVKKDFPLDYFYRTSEVIEEARALGAGIVVPHPEQFWPILLADYDVDGYEVWNPQSHRYTDFLIEVINRKNRERPLSRPRLLLFMGDDTHIGEKVCAPEVQDPDKANREVGYQPAWEDDTVYRKLRPNRLDRETVIAEYRSRLRA